MGLLPASEQWLESVAPIAERAGLDHLASRARRAARSIRRGVDRAHTFAELFGEGLELFRRAKGAVSDG